jgi:phosphate transport system protein
MDRKDFTSHISGAMNQSLEAVFDHILQMGGMVEKQMEHAVEALQKNDVELAREVLVLDKMVNVREVEIDSLCARILARQQPTALDLRLVLSAIRMAVDLERMGDEVVKIAKFILAMAENNKMCSSVHGVDSLIEISLRSSSMLRTALDGFARLNVHEAGFVIKEEEAIDVLYKETLDDLIEQIKKGGEGAACILELIFSLRAAERMSDHARNIGESIIYLVNGQDVRDMDDEALQKFLSQFEG